MAFVLFSPLLFCVTPTSFCRPCRIPQNLRTSTNIAKLQANLSRKLIRTAIRQKYQDIANLKESSNRLRDRIPLSNVSELMERVKVKTKRDMKTSLIKKFNWLRRTVGHRSKDSGYVELQTNRERVSIIGDIDIPEGIIDTFAKGPNFAISRKTTKDELQRTAQVEVAALAYALRWQAAMTSITHTAATTANTTTTTATTTTATTATTTTTNNATTHGDTEHAGPTPINISRKCPFKPKRMAPPRKNMDTENAIRGFQIDMQQIASRNKCISHPNINRQERSAVVELARKDEITITRSDKGGEIVIMKTEELHHLNMEHLGDQSTYERLKSDPTKSLRLTVNKVLHDIMTKRDFAPSLIKRLQTPTTARTQQFYTLPKTHKETLKIRPIVSGRNGIFDRLGWFLQLLLKPLLRQVRAHICNTTELIRRFQECPQSTLKGMIPISLDVVSLYTNINIEEATSTTLQYIQTSNISLY